MRYKGPRHVTFTAALLHPGSTELSASETCSLFLGPEAPSSGRPSYIEWSNSFALPASQILPSRKCKDPLDFANNRSLDPVDKSNDSIPILSLADREWPSCEHLIEAGTE